MKNDGDPTWRHEDDCSPKNPCAECERLAAEEVDSYGVDVEVEDEDGGTWRSFAHLRR